MTVPETANTSSDPVRNNELPKPENSLTQEEIALKGRLFLAALSDGEDIKRALNPEEKLDLETVDSMRGKRLETAEVERKYNPVVSGLSIHERTEKWKGKSFQEAYSQWSTNLLTSINQSESQERKDLISKFFNKDSSEVKGEDVKVLYDKYCRGDSNIDDFVKKAVESESSSDEVEWLAKKLFGAKSGEITRKIYEIEADFRKEPSIYNAIQKANEIFWQSGLNRFNNPNKEEEEILKLLFENFRQAQEKTDEDNEGAPPAPATEDASPESIPPAIERVEPSEPTVEINDEEEYGAPPPTNEAEENTPVESPDPVAEVEPIVSAQVPEPANQPDITEPEKPQPPAEASLADNPEPPEPANEPERIAPNSEPTGTGNPWPPTEVEPINNTATSLVQKIKGIFKK